MRWVNKARLRLRSLFHRSRLDRDLDHELQFYLDTETAKHRAAGLGPAESAQAARRSLGNVIRVKEECRDARGLNALDDARQDLRYAGRALLRSPGFTVAATLIVALGIGANATVFAVVNAVLFRSPPYHDPDRVVSIYQDSDSGDPASSSFPATRDMAAYRDVFSGVAATSSATITWEAGDGPRPALIEFVTASYLPVFGIEPRMGRWFDPAYDQVGAGHYAVVSHRTWRTQFGADPDVVGRAIRMGAEVVTIVGVGPEGFNGSGGPLVTDFWLSISSVGVGGPFRIANLERRQDHWYDVRARLAPDVTVAQAQSAMDGLAARLADEFPDMNLGRRITVFGPGQVVIHPSVDGALVPASAVLLSIVGLVLVLACANLANLQIVRGFSRGHEVAIRRALGASRGRVARLFLTESILLACLGGAVGLLLARWSLDFLPLLAGPVAAAMGGAGSLDVSMDLRVVLYGAGPDPGNRGPVRPGTRASVGAVRRGRRPSRGRTLHESGQTSDAVTKRTRRRPGGRFARAAGRRKPPDKEPRQDPPGGPGGRHGPPRVRGHRIRSGRRLSGRAVRSPGGADGPGDGAAGRHGGRLHESTPGATVVEGYTPPTGTGSVELEAAFVSDRYCRLGARQGWTPSSRSGLASRSEKSDCLTPSLRGPIPEVGDDGAGIAGDERLRLSRRGVVGMPAHGADVRAVHVDAE